jgi:hypothetical protein
MTSVEEHKRKIREHLDEIDDAIDAGIKSKPITIGFHCSACSIEMLELYLHALNKIPMGKIVKHNWFRPVHEGQKSEPLAERMIGVDFPRKDEIFSLLRRIESKRDKLVYGKDAERETAKVLESFMKLKKILFEEIKKAGVEIE